MQLSMGPPASAALTQELYDSTNYPFSPRIRTLRDPRQAEAGAGSRDIAAAERGEASRDHWARGRSMEIWCLRDPAKLNYKFVAYFEQHENAHGEGNGASLRDLGHQSRRLGQTTSQEYR
jgi:hypothetical protein